MAISYTLLDHAATAPLANSASTASVTVNDNRLVTVSFRACFAANPSPDPTLAGLSLTWTLVAKVPDFYSSGGTRFQFLYVYQAFNDSGSNQSGQIAVTFNAQCRTIGYQVIQWNPSGSEILEVKATNVHTNSGTGTSISVSFGSFADAVNNVAFAVMATGGATNSAITTPSMTSIDTENNASLNANERGNEMAQYQVGSTSSATATGNGDNWAAISMEIGAAAGGTEYDRTETDALDLSDSLVRSQDASRPLTDELGLSDLLSPVHDAIRSLADSLSLGDELAYQLGEAFSQTDSLSIAEAVALEASYLRSRADVLSLSDDLVTALDGIRVLSEALGLSDDLASTLTMPRETNDPLTLNDALTLALSSTRQQADLLSLSEEISLALDALRGFGDTLTLTDALTVQLQRAALIFGTLPPKAVWAVLYDSNGNKAGALTRILGAEIDEQINSIGQLTLTVPRADIGSMALFDLGFWREGEGEIFRGYVTTDSTKAADDGSILTALQVEGREVELRWAWSYEGTFLDARDPLSGLSALLTGTGWTGAIEGSGGPAAVTQSFDDMTVFDAILAFAKTVQGYVRFDRVTRIVKVSDEPPDSGITLANIDTPFIGASSSIGVLEALNEISNDKSVLFNRIVPKAKVDAHDAFDLRRSSRSSPYAIDNLVVAPMRVTNTASVSNLDAPSGQTQQHALGINVYGQNRFLIVIVGEYIGDPHSGPNYVLANGRRLAFYDSIETTGVFDRMMIFASHISSGGRDSGAPSMAVDAGYNEITLQWDADPGGSSSFDVVAIALENVIGDGATFVGNEATGNSSSASITLTESFDGELMIGVVKTEGARTSTSGLNQSRLMTSSRIAVDSKPASGSSTSMSWTLSASDNWAALAVAIRPNRAYYIEDAASVTAYGRRVKAVSMGSFRQVSEDLGAVADSMYDAAVDYLQEHKDPQARYAADVAWLPKGPLEWEVGSSMRLRFADATIPIDATLVVPKRTQVFNEGGDRTWKLELDTRNQFRTGFVDVLDEMRRRLDSVQASQV